MKPLAMLWSLELRKFLTIFTHTCMVGALLLLPSVWMVPPPIWRLEGGKLLVLGTFAVAYVIAVALVRRSRWGQGRGAYVLLVGMAAFATCVVAVVFIEWQIPWVLGGAYPKSALAVSFCLGLVGFLLVSLQRRLLVSLMVAGIASVVGVAGHAAYRLGVLPRPRQATPTITYVNTSLYGLQMTTYSDHFPAASRGGGIERLGDGYVIADGDGRLFTVRSTGPESRLEVRQLPHAIPLNTEEFAEGGREVFADQLSADVETWRFRVADIVVRSVSGRVLLMASHHYWHSSGQCFVLRISAIDGTFDEVFTGTRALEWRTVYETSPCLPLNTEGLRGVRFEGLENGGRMALLDRDELLFTVGDHGVDGVNQSNILAQDPKSAYGKILRIHLDSGVASIFSMGHRNPQGLVIAQDRTIWSTEHGPRGGDELNLLRENANYGWPHVSYGTDYARFSWPLNAMQGRHDDFEQPIYAFVPSVGISNLIEVSGERFPLWRQDLLLGSLRGEALWRMRVRHGRVVIAEPIQIGHRIRDLVMGTDGRLALWTDDSAVVFVEPAPTHAGDVLVAQCTACHGLNEWDTSFLAPHLADVVGRPIGSLANFRYSKAMQAAGGRWTRERLDAFLQNPQVALPGTTMRYPGLSDAEQRANLIDYLADRR